MIEALISCSPRIQSLSVGARAEQGSKDFEDLSALELRSLRRLIIRGDESEIIQFMNLALQKISHGLSLTIDVRRLCVDCIVAHKLFDKVTKLTLIFGQ
jgi:hypothetical protein